MGTPIVTVLALDLLMLAPLAPARAQDQTGTVADNVAPADSPASAVPQAQGDADARATIATFKEKNSDMPKLFADAYGYAVFPTVGKGAIGIGGARGKGWVYKRGRLIGRSTLTQVTIGLQLGGQAYSEIVLFQTKQALENFQRGKLKLDAQASAVAITARAATDLAYREGVAIVTMAKGGLMYEASVGGQKFSFDPL